MYAPINNCYQGIPQHIQPLNTEDTMLRPISVPLSRILSFSFGSDLREPIDDIKRWIILHLIIIQKHKVQWGLWDDPWSSAFREHACPRNTPGRHVQQTTGTVWKGARKTHKTCLVVSLSHDHLKSASVSRWRQILFFQWIYGDMSDVILLGSSHS